MSQTPNQQPTEPRRPNSALAVSSLALSLIALFFAVFVNLFTAIPLAIIGIALAVAARWNGRSAGPAATAGLVFSIVTLALSVGILYCVACATGCASL
ncbi:MAG: hypothetical protein FWC93_05580 [Defluviitaleaceae bacterium]|nr:hypothetical protein [Defluviitaleaceae bacterium]